MLHAKQPTLVHRDGVPTWHWQDGTELAVIAGADDAPPPPAGDPPKPDPAAGDPPAGADGDDKLGEGGKKALEAERARAKAAEDELAAAKAKLKEIEDKDKSELDKATARVTELETETSSLKESIREQGRNMALEAAATAAKATKPQGVRALVDMSKVEYDDQGNVKNADALIKTVRDGYPELFSTNGSADGGAREPAAGDGDMNKKIRTAAGH